MNKIQFILNVLLRGVPTDIFVGTARTIKFGNEYGGETMEYTFSPADHQYKDGEAKTIDHWDRRGRLMKLEQFFTEEFARRDGVSKRISHFDSEGYVVKAEEFFIAKRIEYFDKFDLVKEEYYDKDGSLIATNNLDK